MAYTIGFWWIRNILWFICSIVTISALHINWFLKEIKTNVWCRISILLLTLVCQECFLLRETAKRYPVPDIRRMKEAHCNSDAFILWSIDLLSETSPARLWVINNAKGRICKHTFDHQGYVQTLTTAKENCRITILQKHIGQKFALDIGMLSTMSNINGYEGEFQYWDNHV